MAAKRLSPPTEAELEILQTLWQKQPRSVREVYEELSRKRDIGYTTVLKQMQRMYEDKGLLRRHKQGKLHLYEATITEQEVQENLLDRLVNNAFGGSSLRLVQRVLGRGKASQAEIEALQQWLDQQKKQ